MSYRDQLERRWILERESPYWFDICSYCDSYEGEPHEDGCDWVQIRSENHLEVVA